MIQQVQPSSDAAVQAGSLPSQVAPIAINSRRSSQTALAQPIVDTVTLSAAALRPAAASVSQAAVPGAGTKPVEAALLKEFPVQVLFEQGYASSEIAIALDLPKQFVDVELGIPTLNAAA